MLQKAMSLPSDRLVAANPRSYAYLGKRRYLPASAVIAMTTAGMLLEEEEGGERETLPPLTNWNFGRQQARNEMIARNTIIVGDWKTIPICLRRAVHH